MMKIVKNLFFIILFLPLFLSCSEEEKETIESLVKNSNPQTNVENTEVIEDTIIEEISPEEIIDEVIVVNVPIMEVEFLFVNGKCVNENNEIGYNPGYFGACGDLSYQNLDDLNFKHATDLAGLNIEGAYITNSWIDIETIVYFEMKINDDTQIINIPNLESEYQNEVMKQKEDIKNKLLVELKIIEKIRTDITHLMEGENSNLENQLAQKQKLLNSKLNKYYSNLAKLKRFEAYLN